MSEYRDDIYRLASENGWGRTRIMRALPEASEWEVRTVIEEAKQDMMEETDLSIYKPVRPPHFNTVASLRPIEVSPVSYNKYKKNPDELYTVAVLGDVHAPYHSQSAVDLACAVLEEQRKIRLDQVVNLGDLADFYSVSRYDKNPLRRNQLQDELVVCAEVMSQLTEASGDAELHFIEGNHEARLKSYIARTAPALASLPQLQLSALLGLESLGWEYHPIYHLIQDRFLVKHGHLVSSQSGATAKRELDAVGMSGASGHVHRLAHHERTDWSSTINGQPPHIWIETGCLCEPDQEYAQGRPPNWQQGLAIVQFTPDGLVVPTLVRIHGNRAVFNGRVLEV